MDNQYIEYEKDNKKLAAEPIFVSKKPRSRVMLSTVKEVKPEIDKHSFTNENIIDFTSVEKIERTYYLISREEKYYPSLLERIKEGDIKLKEAVKWTKQMLEIWDSVRAENKF